MDIPAIIRREAQTIIDNSYVYGAFSPWHLNNGWCFDVARNVSSVLRAAGVCHEILDDQWLIDEGPRDGRPRGISNLGAHEFLLIGGRYYDAEVPEGVEDPYSLPIVKAAISWRREQKALARFVSDDGFCGPIPCPVAVRDAVIDTWKAFRHAEQVDLPIRNLAFRVAAQGMMEPLRCILSDRSQTLAVVMQRAFLSIGLDCQSETGAAPCRDDDHTWVRFEDGSVIDFDLEGTPMLESGKVGGRVYVCHRDSELNEDYVAKAPRRGFPAPTMS